MEGFECFFEEPVFSFLGSSHEQQDHFLKSIQSPTLESIKMKEVAKQVLSSHFSLDYDCTVPESPVQYHNDEPAEIMQAPATIISKPASVSTSTAPVVPQQPALKTEDVEVLKKQVNLPLFASALESAATLLPSVLEKDESADREWRVLECHNKNLKNLKVSIEIKTRSDKAQYEMPDRLYSSLKYEIRQSISSCVRSKDSSNILMSKMQIVNPNRPLEECLKFNGEKFVTGVQDTVAMTLDKSKNRFEVKTKIQFTDVSFNYEKKNFAMKLSFFDPAHDISKPVLVLLSAPFQVYARRPTIRKPDMETDSNCDAMEEESQEEEEEVKNSSKIDLKATKTGQKRKVIVSRKLEEDSSNKKRKVATATTSSNNIPNSKLALPPNFLPSPSSIPALEPLNQFSSCLDLLLNIKNNLTSQEQKLALELAQSVLQLKPAADNIESLQPMSPSTISTSSSDLSDDHCLSEEEADHIFSMDSNSSSNNSNDIMTSSRSTSESEFTHALFSSY